MKLFLLIILLIFISGSIYLNRSYAHIYSTIGEANLVIPINKKYYLIPSNSNNAIKYVSLGDSLTAGVGSDNYQETLAYEIAQNLSQKGIVTLTDLAIPGATSKQLLETQVPEAINQKPTVITIMIGTNDIHNFVSLSDFSSNLTKILDQLKPTGATIYLVNIPYIGSPNLIKFPFNILLNIQLNRFNQEIKSVADQKNIQYIDLYTKTYSAMSSGNLYYSKDLFHPSGKGYILWGQVINDYSYF